MKSVSRDGDACDGDPTDLELKPHRKRARALSFKDTFIEEMGDSKEAVEFVVTDVFDSKALKMQLVSHKDLYEVIDQVAAARAEAHRGSSHNKFKEIFIAVVMMVRL